MSDIFLPLSAFRKKIGYVPLLFISLAFTTTSFIKVDPKVNVTLTSFLAMVATVLFILGVIIALIRVSSTLFVLRPLRGLLDGLSAGLIAGLIGGLLGYGLHDVYKYPDGYLEKYIEPWYVRVAICIFFTTPIGGLLGLLIDLIHPTNKIDWRKYFGFLILSFILLIGTSGTGIYLCTPDMNGAGIILSDVQLLFEIYLFTILIIVTISFNWPIIKFLKRLPILFIAIALVRIPTFLIISPDPTLEGAKLFKHMFTYDNDSNVHMRISSPGSFPSEVNFAVLACGLMLWTFVAYYVFFRDNRISLWFENLIRNN